MNKRNFYVLLMLISIVIISAAATYTLQMFNYYENNKTQPENLNAANSPRNPGQNIDQMNFYYPLFQDYFDLGFPNNILLDFNPESADNGQFKGEQVKKSEEIEGEKLPEAVDEEAMGAKADSQFVDRIKSQLEQYPDHFFIRSFDAQRKVALTFDDGPGPHTERILDILAEYDVQATFFVVGFQVENFPGLLSRIVLEGHLVGNHSYSHTDFSELSLAGVKREIEHTNQLIKKETGYEPDFIRPPYGRITDQQLENLIEKGYKFINWSVDSLDWDEDHNTHEMMLSRIENTIHPGAIILLHDAGGDRRETEKLLPDLIESLKARGYEFVTVEELLFP